MLSDRIRRADDVAASFTWCGLLEVRETRVDLPVERC